jgi:hypothetical protein
MEKWEYQLVLVNKRSRAVRLEASSGSEVRQFDEKQASDLVVLLRELGQDGWELVAMDPNASYGEGSYSYVGSLYVFQRPTA